MQRGLIIDIQNIGPEDEARRRLTELVEDQIPVYIALTPYQYAKWKPLREEIKKIVTRKGSGLAQEGLFHTCRNRHTRVDPYHEQVCPWDFWPGNLQTTAEEQSLQMKEGKRLLELIFETEVSAFIPTQHQFNLDTEIAAEANGYRFVVSQAVLDNLEPYNTRWTTVVPSASLKKGKINNPVVHVYLDRIEKSADLYDRVLDNGVTPISQLLRDSLPQKTLRHWGNEKMLWAIKYLRDVQNFRNGKRYDSNKFDKAKAEWESVKAEFQN